MTTRPTEEDQIKMVVHNLQPRLLQKMIVLPLPTFVDLHEIGVQIENAMKQGLIDHEKEQPKRSFTCSSNPATTGGISTRPSDVGMVTTTPKTANPFAGTSNTTSQTSSHRA